MNLAFLNIGTQEMMLIIIVILFLFGGKKLPELARGLGRGIREFKDASDGIKREISDQINNFEKDLDVEETTSTTTSSQKSTDMKAEMAQNRQSDSSDSSTESKLPKFGPPAGTYEHNPVGDIDPQEAYYNGSYDQQNASSYTEAPDENEVTPYIEPDHEQNETKKA